MNLTVSLSDKQVEKLVKWEAEQDAQVAADQAKNPRFKGYADAGLLPYYGATGGSLTYHMSPTSLGIVIKVSHGVTNAEIDLTEYEDW